MGESLSTGDLHNHVVQHLFAAGLALHRALGDLPPSAAAQQIEAAIATLDGTIRGIRSAAFALDSAQL